MTPAHAQLLEQIREVFDAPPNARAIADYQALRDGVARQLELPPGACNAQILAALEYRLANRPSMSEISDAADARQLRDRVRGLETRNLALEQETLGEREEVARLRTQLAAVESKLQSVEKTIGAMIEDDNPAEVQVEAWREWACEECSNNGPSSIDTSVSDEEVRYALSNEMRSAHAAYLADEIAWRKWARATYDAIAPINERHSGDRWDGMSAEQIRFNVSAQIELLQRTVQLRNIAPAPNPEHETRIDALVNARIAETNNKQPAA
jgi:hypothetical protein